MATFSEQQIDFKVILIAIIGSLVGYVFYGHIQLEADVSVFRERQQQQESEIDDLWEKYNKEQSMKFEMAAKFYQMQIDYQKDRAELEKRLNQTK